MRTMKSRTTAVLTTAGAALAIAATIYAPMAAADNSMTCPPGQIEINNQCSLPPAIPSGTSAEPVEDDFAPPASDFFAPTVEAPAYGGDSVDIGDGGIDVATGGVDIGGGGVNVGGGGHR